VACQKKNEALTNCTSGTQDTNFFDSYHYVYESKRELCKMFYFFIYELVGADLSG
jgi:hypothetical protein